ncbi:hypothetical protein LTR97_007837 [Elasticomyces elasticus]|uniref:F-box domain-containing protein n=1 Tax=Elasticomyces elasticus TaxID=574655 RepID=A0AAN7W2A2_9PEZI|nr:hypothetical protein LTR97_007837 [Elasticomyces elasticus]
MDINTNIGGALSAPTAWHERSATQSYAPEAFEGGREPDMDHSRQTYVSKGRKTRQPYNFNVDKIRQSRFSSGNAKGSRLLSLPPELRNRIYEYTLSLRAAVLVSGPDDRIVLRSSPLRLVGSNPNNWLALLRTNKQIHNEAATMFYFCNHFEVRAFVPEPEDEYYDGDDYEVPPGVLELEESAPRMTMAPLYKLVQKIGGVHGNAPIHITFVLGTIICSYVRPKSQADVMYRMLEDLRNIQETDPRIRLNASMRHYIDQDIALPNRNTPDLTCYDVTIEISNPISRISAFIAQLSEMFAENQTRTVHDDFDLQSSHGFFRALRKSIEESPKWQQTPEALREGDGKEKAGEDERV